MADRRACDACGSLYQPLRVSSRYCGGTCRKRAQRSGVAASKDPARAPAPRARAPRSSGEVSSVRAAVLAELKAAGKETSALGQQALTVASRLDASHAETGSSLAAVSKELRSLLAEAVGVAKPAGDSLDMLAEQRRKRLAGDR